MQNIIPTSKGLQTSVWLSMVILSIAISHSVPADGQVTYGQASKQLQGTQRFPDEEWLQYADAADAGFSPEGLAKARRFWEHRGSSAFMVVAGGAVVVAWGQVERRFMCHSIRKSLLSALYGIYKDDIDLELTLTELGIDDVPPLIQQEKQARVVDLISSRSGVYHEAAAESQEMSRNRPARGSYGPGAHWCYNNWDFNAAGAVFEQQTGERIFAAFREAVAQPTDMQDYRVSDGFYHYERSRSIHPGYMFRMSTRDLARFGLLYARGGCWKDEQIIPDTWVEESTKPHSAVDMGSKYGSGYGYMWWIEGARGYTARGSGGHILAVYPPMDLVMVIRADTYHDRPVSTRACMRLFNMVVEASHGERARDPRLVCLPSTGIDREPPQTLSAKQLASYPREVEMESGRKVVIAADDEVLTVDYGYGTFRLLPQSGTRFIAEDSEDPVVFELDADGRVNKVWIEQLCYLEAAAAVRRGHIEGAVTWVSQAAERFPESARAHYNLAKALHGTGRSSEALNQVRAALDIDPDINGAFGLLIRLYLHRFSWVIGIFALILVWQVVRRVRQRAGLRGTRQ